MQTERGVQWEARGKSAALAVPGNSVGFLYHYGTQAWIDVVMPHTMIARHARPIISYTFLPTLRPATDAGRIDREYAETRSRRETVRIFDSPRERRRRSHGNFIREQSGPSSNRASTSPRPITRHCDRRERRHRRHSWAASFRPCCSSSSESAGVLLGEGDAGADFLPNFGSLPAQGALLICKGTFEKLFDGKDGGLAVEFDPYLPETSCSVRMRWKVR